MQGQEEILLRYHPAWRALRPLIPRTNIRAPLVTGGGPVRHYSVSLSSCPPESIPDAAPYRAPTLPRLSETGFPSVLFSVTGLDDLRALYAMGHILSIVFFKFVLLFDKH
jgi:hypothetical protein